jgi:uncharacterized membrane protein
VFAVIVRHPAFNEFPAIRVEIKATTDKTKLRIKVMPEIIPNHHPVFVHFTVALLFLAVGLFMVTPFLKGSLKEQWCIVARWLLWFGAGFTIITGLTGLYTYNTVAHDTPSHLAMTNHRNWAIATITAFLVLASWSITRLRTAKHLGMVFVVFLILSGGLLGATAWRGGELVYRYGLGVMSLPKADNHRHGEDEAHDHDHSSVQSPETDAGSFTEDHDHGDEYDPDHMH